jgi:hypothetical protein
METKKESALTIDEKHDMVTKLLTAFATVNILSMDMGLPYSERQKNILKNKLIVLIIVYASAFQLLKNKKLAVALAGLYFFISY